MPTHSRALRGVFFGEQRNQSQHADLSHLANGHQAAATHADDFVDDINEAFSLILELSEERRRVHKVKLVHAADRNGDQEEREEWLKADRIQSTANRAFLFLLGRRRGG